MQVKSFFAVLQCSAFVGAVVAINDVKVMRSEMKKPTRTQSLTMSGGEAAMLLNTNPNVPDKAANNIYPLGQNNSVECTDTVNHDLITDPDMCLVAAGKTNACIENWPGQSSNKIPEAGWDNHPRGCFAWPCQKAGSTCSSGMCYYYNEVGGQEGSIQGQPVCYAAMYLNGTELTGEAPTTNHGCPAGYEAILDETQCRAYAKTNSYCVDLSEFRVGISGGFNATRQHDFPEGCFISTDAETPEPQRCVYFNDLAFIGHTEPKHPHGIPACNSTTDGHWWPDQASSFLQEAEWTRGGDDDDEE